MKFIHGLSNRDSVLTICANIAQIIAAVATISALIFAYVQYRNYQNDQQIIIDGFNYEVDRNLIKIHTLSPTSTEAYNIAVTTKVLRLDHEYLDKIKQLPNIYHKSNEFRDILFLSSDFINTTNNLLNLGLSQDDLNLLKWQKYIPQIVGSLVVLREELNGGIPLTISKDYISNKSFGLDFKESNINCSKLKDIKLSLENNLSACLDELSDGQLYYVFLKHHETPDKFLVLHGFLCDNKKDYLTISLDNKLSIQQVELDKLPEHCVQ